MKYTLAGCLSAALLLFAPAILTAQVQTTDGPPMSSQKLEFNITNLNGMPVHGEARGMRGLNYSAAVSVTTMDSRSVLHRLFLDRNHQIYFGYDLEAYQVQGQNQVHLHFAPLSSLSSFAGIDVSNFKPENMTLPADQTIPINSAFEVPLEVSESGGKVLRDRLTFGPNVN